ncbi:methionine aminotransferase [Lewinella cohaerens]|uniref:methionine aminotransferase n=1 Tax=Lewinella cohaerens TaxID=70995 RepID=UPI000377EAA1|nr:methionine aminotransferase [Lewinella cohaerens]
MPTTNFASKLPNTGTSIFSVMSALAREHKAINLSQGFPNYDPPAELRRLVNSHLESGHNQYAPMPGLPELRKVITDKHKRSSGNDINPETEITITSGATQAIFCAITTVVRPGDEVILIEPAYDSYRPVVELSGGKVVAYQLTYPDYQIDWEAFAKLLTDRTRLIILNTPHNPTGTIWQKKDWEQLEQLVAGTDIFVLSDEVYEQLVYDGQRHYSLLDFPALFERGFATYSFGKTFHSTGWKVGYCLAPDYLMKEFRKIHQFNVFSVNTPVQYALADYLKDPDTYGNLSSFYQQKRDFLLQRLEGLPLQPLPCAGTYFQLFDYRQISDAPDLEFASWLTTEIGVAVIPVSAFRSVESDERVVRICFAKTEEVLSAAAEVLRERLS